MKVTVYWNEGCPLACWHVLGYTKSTMQVWQIPEFQVTKPKMPGVTACCCYNAYHEKYTLLQNLQNKFPIAFCSCPKQLCQSFIC